MAVNEEKSFAQNRINWFPGHMAKTERQMQKSISLVDLVIEVVDARIPVSSKNPYLDKLWSRRPRIIALNKADLADPEETARFRKWYEAQGFGTIAIDSLHGKGMRDIQPLAQKLCADKLQREKERGREGRRLRLMITGIPNVGKSTLINRLTGRSEAAKTGNKPGVTKHEQWIRIGSDMELLDTPGILWPKFEDQETGYRIACIGSISEDVVDPYTVSLKLLDFIRPKYSKELAARYRFTDDELELTAEELLPVLAKHRGFVLGGGRPDLERAANTLLDDYRSGRIGRITLEQCPEILPEEAAGTSADKPEEE
ncbi:MAG: ribosome biogenesis GTPase YlqF [Firmicutes bacterium]|nr:ribosome biogenesis GTPase YlqF [Bacillota bacterium]